MMIRATESRPLLAAIVCCATSVLVTPPADASSLRTVPTGQPPGPPLLYRSPPRSPLSVRPPFAAAPLRVSGTDAYRRGEYLYQDYLFDDRGADTVPGPGARFENGRNLAAPTAGDVFYPTAERYAGNAADLVELRIKPLEHAIVYRVTLNTVRARDAAIVGIGVDTDRSGGAPVPWPLGAGISSPGLDRFITAWGTGGQVASLHAGKATALPAGSVRIDRASNQMTIRVPRSIMDPRRSRWRYVAGTGLWAGHGWKPVPAGGQPTATTAASGNQQMGAPAVYNLAFRFHEPSTSKVGPPYTTAPGLGSWFEDAQALALRNRTTGGLHADVDFRRLACRATAWVHGPGRVQARIFASRFQPFEGVRPGFPGYGTRLQPYVLVVPPSYRRGRPAPLTFALHSGYSSYTQYAVYDPNMYRQLGDQRRSLVLTPFGRGPDTKYIGIGESDVFEAWADAARHFTLDPWRVALTGYSFGGYGAYRLGMHYPDLFGRAFTAVGLPADQGWSPPAPPVPGGQITNVYPLVGNARWVPYLDWAQATDEINPYPGPRKLQDRFTELGLRSRLWTYTSGDHFTLAAAGDEWAGARDFLGAARVKGDPSRVDYAFLPQAETPAFGLRQDHAYWVSRLRARDRHGDPSTDPAVGSITARSRAFGEGDPLTRRIVTSGVGAGPPMPSAIDGVEWTGIPHRSRHNALAVRLANVASVALDGCRARLRSGRPVRVSVTSDGPAAVRLVLPLAPGSAVATQGAGAWGSASRTGAVLRVGAGTSSFVVTSPTARSCSRGQWRAGPAKPYRAGE
jgi:hypothetical protein